MKLKFALLFLLLSSVSRFLSAQTISKEELIFLTSEWKGERFPDGRPKIPDALLERAKHIMIDDAWTVLRNEGYVNQYCQCTCPDGFYGDRCHLLQGYSCINIVLYLYVNIT